MGSAPRRTQLWRTGGHRHAVQNPSLEAEPAEEGTRCPWAVSPSVQVQSGDTGAMSSVWLPGIEFVKRKVKRIKETQVKSISKSQN